MAGRQGWVISICRAITWIDDGSSWAMVLTCLQIFATIVMTAIGQIKEIYVLNRIIQVMNNKIKTKMQQEAVLGVFQGFNAPNLVEIIGYAGLDFIVFDSEHGYMSPETMENMIRAAE